MSDEGDVYPNAVLTFRDENGVEWLAAAHLGPLQLSGTRIRMPVDEMKDHVLVLTDFRIVSRP